MNGNEEVLALADALDAYALRLIRQADGSQPVLAAATIVHTAEGVRGCPHLAAACAWLRGELQPQQPGGSEP